jgi:hypothetical protein
MRSLSAPRKPGSPKGGCSDLLPHSGLRGAIECRKYDNGLSQAFMTTHLDLSIGQVLVRVNEVIALEAAPSYQNRAASARRIRPAHEVNEEGYLLPAGLLSRDKHNQTLSQHMGVRDR